MCPYIQQAVKIAEKFDRSFLVSRLFINDMTEILFRSG